MNRTALLTVMDPLFWMVAIDCQLPPWAASLLNSMLSVTCAVPTTTIVLVDPKVETSTAAPMPLPTGTGRAVNRLLMVASDVVEATETGPTLRR